MSEFNKIMSTDTSAMSVDELKAFAEEKLIPALEEEWGNGGYYIMECSSPDILVAKICDECEGIKSGDDCAYFALSDEVVEYGDYEDIFCVGGYEDEEVYQAVDMEDCVCEDELD